MTDFILLALPCVVLGVVSVIMIINFNRRNSNTKDNAENKKDYISIGMSLGMCFGVAIGSALMGIFGAVALNYGICFGSIFGMTLGMYFNKK